jgi:hypothetical protein
MGCVREVRGRRRTEDADIVRGAVARPNETIGQLRFAIASIGDWCRQRIGGPSPVVVAHKVEVLVP